jgi:hypothetical protein
MLPPDSLRYRGTVGVQALERGLVSKLERIVAAPEELETNPYLRSATLSLLVWLVTHGAFAARALAFEFNRLVADLGVGVAGAQVAKMGREPVEGKPRPRDGRGGGDDSYSDDDFEDDDDADDDDAAARNESFGGGGCDTARLSAAAWAFPALAHLLAAPSLNETLAAAPHLVKDLATLVESSRGHLPDQRRLDSAFAAAIGAHHHPGVPTAAASSTHNVAPYSGLPPIRTVPDLQQQVLLALQSLCRHTDPLLLPQRGVVAQRLLPALAALLDNPTPTAAPAPAGAADKVGSADRAGSADDVRATAVCLLRLLLPPLLVDEARDAADAAAVVGEGTTRSRPAPKRPMAAAAARLVLPRCPALLADHEPIPHFALALLADVAAADPAAFADAMRQPWPSAAFPAALPAFENRTGGQAGGPGGGPGRAGQERATVVEVLLERSRAAPAHVQKAIADIADQSRRTPAR